MDLRAIVKADLPHSHKPHKLHCSYNLNIIAGYKKNNIHSIHPQFYGRLFNQKDGVRLDAPFDTRSKEP